MSIQRFRHHGGHGDSWCISEHVNGELVLYADHVAAVAEQHDILREEKHISYMEGQEAERARIKALIASLEYDGDYCKVLHSCDLLTAIDGEDK